MHVAMGMVLQRSGDGKEDGIFKELKGVGQLECRA